MTGSDDQPKASRTQAIIDDIAVVRRSKNPRERSRAIRRLKAEEWTRTVRLRLFREELERLIDSTSLTMLFAGDTTRPALNDMLAVCIREAVWRKANGERGREAAVAAERGFEAIEDMFLKPPPPWRGGDDEDLLDG